MPASFYQISISNPGGNAAPNDGFIDPTKLQYYVPNLEDPPVDLTDALTTAKRRGNLRFSELISTLGYSGNFYIDNSNIALPGASYDAEPTSITITGEVAAGVASLVTADELNPGQTLTGIAAVVRFCARALVATLTLETDVFDPTPTPTAGNSKAVPRFGVRVAPIVIGPVAADLTSASGLVSVTQLVPGN